MLHLSAKTEYGCLAMLELAKAYESDEAVRVREIAEEHDVPSGFLVQILLQLKAAGLVRSLRGAGGGYRLAHAPESISFADIVGALDGQMGTVSSHLKTESATAEVLSHVWSAFAEAQQAWLEETTLAELVERLTPAVAEMYYI